MISHISNPPSRDIHVARIAKITTTTLHRTVREFFRGGFDTWTIARRFNLPEARICRLLDEAREAERASRG